MMTREELEAALEWVTRNWLHGPEFSFVIAAARKQVALMPVDCPDCDGHGCFGFSELQPGGGETCKPCHGLGKVYPPETVEKIAEAIDSISDEVWGYRGRQAVAVLDALGESE